MESTSVEIRIGIDGECTCGILHLSTNPPPFHTHWAGCDWGIIEHPTPRPQFGEVGHLMLAMGWYAGSLLRTGCRREQSHGGTESCTARSGRVFFHLDYEDHRWTWELSDAHFADGIGPKQLMIGRWPD